MGLSGCYTCIKYLMVFINILFWLFGFGIVLLSIWMLTDPTFYLSMTQFEHNYNIALYVLLGIGALWLVVAFLGCCGAFRESQCMLISFFSFLLVILVAEIAAGVWCYTNHSDLEANVRQAVKKTVQEEYSVVESRTLTFDTIQSKLHCCGADSPQDWAESKFNQGSKYTATSLSVSVLNPVFNMPKSCCVEGLTVTECDVARKTGKIGAIISNTLYTQGCTDKFIEVLKLHMMIAGAIGIGIIAIELLGIILSLVLCVGINRSDRYKA